MASSVEFVDYIVGQIDGAGDITYRKMFGEYGIYCDGKIFALICDDQLFIKPTKAGREFIDSPEEAPPYPGAKPYFLIDDRFEDKNWICQLVTLTASDLPVPKKKSPKAKKASVSKKTRVTKQQ